MTHTHFEQLWGNLGHTLTAFFDLTMALSSKEGGPPSLTLLSSFNHAPDVVHLWVVLGGFNLLQSYWAYLLSSSLPLFI